MKLLILLVILGQLLLIGGKPQGQCPKKAETTSTVASAKKCPAKPSNKKCSPIEHSKSCTGKKITTTLTGTDIPISSSSYYNNTSMTTWLEPPDTVTYTKESSTETTVTTDCATPTAVITDGGFCDKEGYQFCRVDYDNVEAISYWQCVDSKWQYNPCDDGSVCEQIGCAKITCEASSPTNTPPVSSTATSTEPTSSPESSTSESSTEPVSTTEPVSSSTTSSTEQPTSTSDDENPPPPTTTTESSTTSEPPTSTTATPTTHSVEPHNDEPTQGGTCSPDGLQLCPTDIPRQQQYSYWECANYIWYYRPCALGTVCDQISSDRILCDYP